MTPYDPSDGEGDPRPARRPAASIGDVTRRDGSGGDGAPLAAARREEAPGDGRALLALDRRRFLQAAGFSFAGAAATACSPAPVERAIPFLVAPEEVVPGRSYWMSSTCRACPAGCGALVKCRDGRPLKLEGNPEHPASRGGLCAVGQASLLGLYDDHRLAGPLAAGRPASWAAVDAAIGGALAAIAARGGRVRLLTETVNSPTERAAIARFLARFADGRHVVYDPLSSSPILAAHARTHGVRALPRYRFERAAALVSFDCDFLGTWVSPVEHTAGYRAARDLSGTPPRLSWHLQLEGRQSLTGSRADRRVRLLPGEEGLVLSHLAAALAARAGVAFAAGALAPAPLPAAVLADAVERLWAARGRSLVVSGSDEVAVQVLVNFVNHLLGNYGATLDLEQPSYQRQGDDAALAALLAELEGGGPSTR